MSTSGAESIRFELDPRIDPGQLQANFQSKQRIHWSGLVPAPAAQALHRYLEQENGWSLVFNEGSTLREATAQVRQGFEPGFEVRLAARAYERARQGFQYFHEVLAVSADPRVRAQRPTPLARFVDFLNSEPFLDFARRLTGIADIAWADGRATRHRVGHFQRALDDAAGEPDRRIAYVFNVTPQWHADWGGQLQFVDEDGHVARAYVPHFNAMDLFKVPQRHAVSIVAPFAAGSRYAVTGWLRSGAPPR